MTSRSDSLIESGADKAAGVLRRTFTAAELALDDLALEADGALIISGEAASLATKKRALRLAAAASGASGLVDRLRVRASQAMSDAQIRNRIAELLVLDPRFQDLAIEVDRNPEPLVDDPAPAVAPPDQPRGRVCIEVRDGVVTLDGAVPSLVRQRLAGAIAWRVAGVRDVVNGLAVEPPEADSPDQIAEAVREGLQANPLFDARQVKVGVSGDTVRLTGFVHTDAARQIAEDEAWRVLGVCEVINEIEASPSA